MPAHSAGKPLVCMIALNKGTLPDMALVVEALASRFPGVDPPSEATRGTESAVFRWGPGPIAVALKTEPIPEEELEAACQAAWWWEGASEKLHSRKAHLIVSLAPSSEDAVDRHVRMTHVVAAVVSQCDAAGVYWPAAGIVHEPRAFQEQAADLSRESLDPALWIDMHIAPNDDDTWTFYTTGMTALGRPEIEISSTRHLPTEIYELCGDVIRYLLVSGEDIADGGMISRTDDEQIEVHYGPSMFDEEVEVMQLAF